MSRNNRQQLYMTGSGVQLYHRHHDSDDEDDDEDRRHDDETYTFDPSENNDDATEYSEYPETPMQDLNNRRIYFRHYQESPTEGESETGWSEGATSVTSPGTETQSSSYSTSGHSSSQDFDLHGRRRSSRNSGLRQVPLLDNVTEEDEQQSIGSKSKHLTNERDFADDLSLNDDALSLNISVKSNTGSTLADRRIQYLSKIGSISHMSQHFLSDDYLCNDSPRSSTHASSHASNVLAALKKSQSYMESSTSKHQQQHNSSGSSSHGSATGSSTSSTESSKQQRTNTDNNNTTDYSHHRGLHDLMRSTSSNHSSSNNLSQDKNVISNNDDDAKGDTNVSNATSTKPLISYTDRPKKPNRTISSSISNLSFSLEEAEEQQQPHLNGTFDDVARRRSTLKNDDSDGSRSSKDSPKKLDNNDRLQKEASYSSRNSSRSILSNNRRSSTNRKNSKNPLSNHSNSSCQKNYNPHDRHVLNSDSIDMTEMLHQSDEIDDYDYSYNNDNESRHNDSRTTVLLSRKIHDITASLARETNRNKEKIKQEKDRFDDYDQSPEKMQQKYQPQQQVSHQPKYLDDENTIRTDDDNDGQQQQDDRRQLTEESSEHQRHDKQQDDMPIVAPGVFVPGQDHEETRRFSHILRLANDASMAFASLYKSSKGDIVSYLDDDETDANNDDILYGIQNTTSRDSRNQQDDDHDDDNDSVNDGIPKTIPYFKSSSIESLQVSRNQLYDDVSMLESGSSLIVEDLQRSGHTTLLAEYQQNSTKQLHRQPSYHLLQQRHGSSGNNSSTQSFLSQSSGANRRKRLQKSMSFDSLFPSPWTSKKSVDVYKIEKILETPSGDNDDSKKKNSEALAKLLQTPSAAMGDSQPILPVRIATPSSGDGSNDDSKLAKSLKLQSLLEPLRSRRPPPRQRRHSLDMGLVSRGLPNEEPAEQVEVYSSQKNDDKSDDKSNKKKESFPETITAISITSKSKPKLSSPPSPDSAAGSKAQSRKHRSKESRSTSPKESALRETPKESLHTAKSPLSMAGPRHSLKRADHSRDKNIGTTIIIPIKKEEVDENIGTTIIIPNNISLRHSLKKEKYEYGKYEYGQDGDIPVLRLPQGHQNFSQVAPRRFSTGVDMRVINYHSAQNMDIGNSPLNFVAQKNSIRHELEIVKESRDEKIVNASSSMSQFEQSFHGEKSTKTAMSQDEEKGTRKQQQSNGNTNGKKKSTRDEFKSSSKTFVISNVSLESDSNDDGFVHSTSRKVRDQNRSYEHQHNSSVKPSPHQISDNSKPLSSDEEITITKRNQKQSKRALTFGDGEYYGENEETGHNELGYEEYDADTDDGRYHKSLPKIPLRRPTKTGFVNESNRSSFDEIITRADRAFSGKISTKPKVQNRDSLLDEESRSDGRDFYLKHHVIERRTMNIIAVMFGCTLFVLGIFAGSFITILTYDGRHNMNNVSPTTNSYANNNLLNGNNEADTGTQTIFNTSSVVARNETNTTGS